MLIYLDHQASTPMHPAALAATCAAMGEHHANPHSGEHAAGWRAAEAIDAARLSVANAIGCDPDEIVFTSGATEANNLALFGAADADGLRRRVVVGALEHKAVLGPAGELGRRGFDVAVAPPTRQGIVDPEAAVALINDGTALVSVMLVNNELGTVQPLSEIADACARVGAILHVDAAQALGWMPVDVDTLGADMVSLSGHKMGGPKGIGALFIRRGLRERLRPLLFGGEQEDGLRPGTLPTPLCVGFGVACRELPDRDEVACWSERGRRLEAALLALTPDAVVNGAGADRRPGATSLTLPGVDADALIARLAPEVAVSTGSACTSGMPEPSHVLRAIGLSVGDCRSTVRVSVGRFTTAAEVEAAAAAFRRAVTDLRANAST